MPVGGFDKVSEVLGRDSRYAGVMPLIENVGGKDGTEAEGDDGDKGGVGFVEDAGYAGNGVFRRVVILSGCFGGG